MAECRKATDSGSEDSSDESDTLLREATRKRVPEGGYWFPKVREVGEQECPRSRQRSRSKSVREVEEHRRLWLRQNDLDRFANEVRHSLSRMTSIAWLDIDHVAIQGQQEFHDVITDSQSIILDMESRGWDFKIGITQDPIHRWSLPGNPYDEEWDKMMLLYAAEESSKHVKESSGALEKHLIDRMWHLPRCYNQENTGGLSATAGRPHWCYCVLRKTKQHSCDQGETVADTLFRRHVPHTHAHRHSGKFHP